MNSYMTTELKLIGPIDVDYHDEKASKCILPENKKEFLVRLENQSLADKSGVYIFAMRSGKGFTPWYVGKATKTMRQECMEQHKLNKYGLVFAKGIHGSPVMFFIVPEGTKKKVPGKICSEVEKGMIQYALVKNPELLNVQNAKGPDWLIDGVIRGKDKPTSDESAFKTMMGI